MKLSPEKIHSLSAQIHRLLLADEDVEYFVSEEELRREVARALEREMAADEALEARAREKVRSIKRRIPEDSPEFHTLALQFYYEFLDRGL